MNKTEAYWRTVERQARAEMWGWIIFSGVCLIGVVFGQAFVAHVSQRMLLCITISAINASHCVDPFVYNWVTVENR